MKTVITLVSTLIICVTSSAMAADADAGKDVFAANCTTCHSGGKNVIVPDKTLLKTDLEENKRYSELAIIKLINEGSSPMPAFGTLGTISKTDIENVAAYVMKKAEAGW